MSTRHEGAPRRRRAEAGGADDGAFDWFGVLDVAVWVSVAIIVIIGLEYLAGKMVRDNIARGAAKYLKKQAESDAAA